MTITEHLMRWDPGRVSAEVGAKRAILSIHCPANGDPAYCQGCGASFQEEWMERIEECPTLLALVQPYADHADFDPAWRTE